MSPLIGAHQLGWDGDLVVQPAEANSTALISLTTKTYFPWDDPDSAGFDAVEHLERADVERLRDLCDEALA